MQIMRTTGNYQLFVSKMQASGMHDCADWRIVGFVQVFMRI